MLIRVIGKAVLFPDNVSLSLTFYGYFKRQPAFDSSPLCISLYPVHLISVIFQNKSFTGDIVKYDQERKQLIVKNFKKSMSTIIRISDIQKISLVPHTIRIAQQKTP